MISKFLQILGLQHRISKVFLTVGQNNFGNKIPHVNIIFFFLQQHHEKGQLLEAGQEIFSNHNAIHHLHETFTKQVEKEYL